MTFIIVLLVLATAGTAWLDGRARGRRLGHDAGYLEGYTDAVEWDRWTDSIGMTRVMDADVSYCEHLGDAGRPS